MLFYTGECLKWLLFSGNPCKAHASHQRNLISTFSPNNAITTIPGSLRFYCSVNAGQNAAAVELPAAAKRRRRNAQAWAWAGRVDCRSHGIKRVRALHLISSRHPMQCYACGSLTLPGGACFRPLRFQELCVRCRDKCPLFSGETSAV